MSKLSKGDLVELNSGYVNNTVADKLVWLCNYECYNPVLSKKENIFSG